MKSIKKQPVYTPPVIITLGQVNTGIGACNPGTSHGANCEPGAGAGNKCTTGTSGR